MAANVLSPDSLGVNRSGQLSDTQRQGLAALASSNRRSALTFAALFAAMGLLIAFSTSTRTSPAQRTLVSGSCLAIALVAGARSVTRADALSRDLRDGRVESTEGAIGKRRVSAGRARSTHYLDVGDRRFRVAMSTYTNAPDAGFVRLFFLPRSRKIVNYELLPQVPVSAAESLRDAGVQLGKAMLLGTPRQRNEARAERARFSDAFEAARQTAETTVATGEADTRPLAEAIVGTWTSGVVRATFSADGQLAVNVFGVATSGRWSVDGQGRLAAEINGRAGTTDARIIGQQLTVTLDGQRLTLSRHA